MVPRLAVPGGAMRMMVAHAMMVMGADPHESTR